LGLEIFFNYYTVSNDAGVSWSTPLVIGVWPQAPGFTGTNFMAVSGTVVHIYWSMLLPGSTKHSIYYTNNPTANAGTSSTNAPTPLSTSGPTAPSGTTKAPTAGNTIAPVSGNMPTAAPTQAPTVAPTSAGSKVVGVFIFYISLFFMNLM